MKYICEVVINKPLKQVIELFDNPDNLKHWQEGLISFEPISGTPGQVGSKAKLKFKMGKGEIDMIETITVRDLPREFSGTYEAKGVFNVVVNRFEAETNSTTKYICENEFRFTSFFMKAIGFLMPGAFKKQSQKFMNDFKSFCEKQA